MFEAKIDTDEVACEEGASDYGEMEQFELIKDVSSKETILSDGNDTDSSFGEIDSENEVKNLYIYFCFLQLCNGKWQDAIIAK